MEPQKQYQKSEHQKLFTPAPSSNLVQPSPQIQKAPPGIERKPVELGGSLGQKENDSGYKAYLLRAGLKP